MKKILIGIVAGIAVIGIGIGIAFGLGLFNKDDENTITPIEVTSVSIIGEDIVAVHVMKTYTVVVLPSDATVKTVTWAVTEGDGAITRGGVFTAYAAGSITITATANNGVVGSKVLTAYANQTAADEAAIAAAKSAIEDLTFTAPQASVTDISEADAYIQSVLATLSLNGVVAEVEDGGTFTPAIPGTALTPLGTNGSYTFTIKLDRGNSEDTTETITLTITATPYDSTTQDNADITTARGIVESASYTTDQATVTNISQARSTVVEIIDTLSLDSSVTIEVVDGTFTAAIAGTAQSVLGTNGSYTFTVKLRKGLGTEQVTDTLTLLIVATPLDNNARVEGAKATIEEILDNDAVYSSTNCGNGPGTTTLRLYIEGLIEGIDDLYGVNLGVSGLSFTTNAVDGTILDADGTNGSASFTVEIVYGNGEITDTVVRNVTITATTTFNDDDTIGDALTLLDTALPQQLTASATNNSLTAMHNLVNTESDQVKTSHDITYSITNEDFKAAVNGVKPEIGTEEGWLGEDGLYTCTITIEKGDGEERILEVSIVLLARDYVTEHLTFTAINVAGVSGLEVSASSNLNATDDSSIVIPAEYNGAPVLRIVNGGPTGFNNKSFIKLVIIPDGVKELGINAFFGCASLLHVSIPDSVERINDGAFSGCTSLESIELPENEKFTTIATDSFRDTGLKSIIIPEKVTTIESTAFFGCLELTSVTMNGVTTIGNGAFNGCSKLVNLTLSQNVESIGGAAFYGISIILYIENPGIEFRGNVFSTNVGVEIYFNGTQAVFEDLEIYTYNTGTSTWEESGTTLHSTLPAKTKVYFKDSSALTYDPITGYTAAVVYNP